ncbi:MAG: helix-turn-helix transcriptional regulator [Acetobacteraceae bacterium]
MIEPVRSTDPGDYQAVPRPLAAMAKQFPDGFSIQPHSHARDQLVYAVTGTMRVHTEREAWIVPTDRAVYLPAGIVHAIDMRGDVGMRTVYLLRAVASDLPREPTVIEVSALLRALILALVEEPVLYDEAGRGGAIARLILSEIGRAPVLPLGLPMPDDARLRRVCLALLADPADPRGLEGWAEMAGASARTLARLFEREVGVGFIAWRQRVRFHSAMESLARGETVARVAARHGYRSTSAFTAAFRRTMGVAPSTAIAKKPVLGQGPIGRTRPTG